MANEYKSLRDKQQEEFSSFPIAFAFSDKQFNEAMVELGLKPTEHHRVYSVMGGGLIRKEDSQKFNDMLVRFEKEIKDAIDSDTTGEGFIYDMFSYELANHEYGYTYELEPTLDALGLTYEEVQNNERLKIGLSKAIKDLLKD